MSYINMSLDYEQVIGKEELTYKLENLKLNKKSAINRQARFSIKMYTKVNNLLKVITVDYFKSQRVALDRLKEIAVKRQWDGFRAIKPNKLTLKIEHNSDPTRNCKYKVIEEV